MALEDKISCNRQTRGARTHHGHPFPGRRSLGRQVSFPKFPFKIRRKALQVPNGYGISLLGQDARPLALDLLRADPATNGGEGISFPYLPDGLGEFLLLDQFDKGGDVNSHGATLHTGGFLALQTPFCLFYGQFRG